MKAFIITLLVIYTLGLVFVSSVIITNLISGNLKEESPLNVIGVWVLMVIFSPLFLLAFIIHILKLLVTMPRKK